MSLRCFDEEAQQNVKDTDHIVSTAGHSILHEIEAGEPWVASEASQRFSDVLASLVLEPRATAEVNELDVGRPLAIVVGAEAQVV